MKVPQNLIIGLTITAFALSFSVPAYAKWEHHKNMQSHIKTMRDAAAVLQVTRPDLAKDLNEFADQEEKEMKEFQEQNEATIKDLRDSAIALQGAHPNLANDLNQLADQKTKMMQGEAKEWKTKDVNADITLLRDSAAVLQPSNAELAGKLTKLADKKEAMKQWMKNENAEEGMEKSENATTENKPY